MAMASAFNGYDEILKRLLILLLFKLLRMVLGFFQTIYWTINGTLDQLHASKFPENYDRCVHVMDVVWFNSFDLLKRIAREDYILTHNRFESPEFILKTDEVTLMALEKEGAIFAEARPGQHLWKSQYNSFYRIAQMERSIRLLFVPMNQFIKMGEKLGDPKHHMICLFNNARCGSTLFTQIMEMTDCCVSLSEPDSLLYLSEWYRAVGETPEVREVTVATMRWLCRPFSHIKQKATVLKFQAPCVALLPVVLKLYPTSKFLYMYREVEKSAKSIYRMAQELPLLKIGVNFSKYHAFFSEQMLNTLGYHGPDYRFKSIEVIDTCIFLWALWTREYLTRRRSGLPVAAVRYEDLIKTPRFAVEQILQYCELPMEVVDKAMRGFEVDSQKNSPISQAHLGKHKDPELTPGAEQRAIKLLMSFDISPPVIRGPILLEGTITCQE